MHDELDRIKTVIINRVAVLTVFMMLPAYITSLLRIGVTGWQTVYIYQTLLYFLIVLVAIFRHKLGLNQKIYSIASIYILVAFLALYYFSIAGNYAFLIITIAVLSLLLSKKITMWIMVGVLLAFAFFAYLYVSGIHRPVADLNQLSAMPFEWLSVLFAVATLIVIFVYGFGDIYAELLHTIKEKNEHEKKFRLLFEQANDAIFLLKDDVFFDCNEQACTVFQYSKHELLGKSVVEVSPTYQDDGQPSATKAKYLISQCLQGKSQQFDWQHLNAKGRVFHVSVSLNRIALLDKVYVQVILRDMTERKRKDAELVRRRKEYADFIRYNYSGICKLEMLKPISLHTPRAEQVQALLHQFCFTECNEQFAHMYGYKAKDLLGQPVKTLWGDDANAEEIMGTMVDARYEWNNVELYEITQSGKELYTLNSVQPVVKANKIYSIWVICTNITEQKHTQQELSRHKEELELMVQDRTKDLKAALEEWKSTTEELAAHKKVMEQQNEALSITVQDLRETQAQLLQAEKMASLGVLTAGISHEINNPLNYLTGVHYGLVNYFQQYGSQDEATTNLLLSSTETAVNRIATIVKGLNQFSRDNQSFEEDCYMHQILDNSLAVMRNQMKHKVELVKDYCAEEPIVQGNVAKLHQVFLQVFTNALQAMAGEGQLAIATRVQNKQVQIRISDTGCGIDPENLARIADPFFTTKDPGEGTGLGLAITYTIIQDHQGSIHFESEPQKGTHVNIILPQKI